MKKIIFSGLLMFVVVSFVKAQQLPQYSQYILNRYVINPASAGTENYYVGQSNYRSQWEGIKDAPRTYILGVNGPLDHQRMGIGGYMFTDITGPTRRNGINLSYAYHVKLSETVKLSMAINAGVLQYAVDGSEIIFENPDDNIGVQSLESTLLPDAGFSFYLYGDKFFLGASAPQLIQNQLEFEETINNPTGRLSNHYFLMGGYTLNLNNSFDLEPSFLLKYVDPIPLQYEATLRSVYKETAWVGVSYRQEAALGLLIGYTIQNNLSLGYSYDIIQSDISNYSTGTHELMLSIKFNNRGNSSSSDE